MNSHYSPEFLAEQKAKLLQTKEELVSELSKIARFDDASGTYMAIQPDLESGSPEDAGDNSLETETAQTNMALISELETTLGEVEAALSKMEEGKYGICDRTGEWIAEDRLRAYPAASTCED